VGKTQIWKSLRTKDLKEARQKVKIESVQVDASFAAAEASWMVEPNRFANCLARRSIGGSASISFDLERAAGFQTLRLRSQRRLSALVKHRGMELVLIAQIRNRHVLDEVFAQNGHVCCGVKCLRVFSVGLFFEIPTQ
jgi:hypothetical protein